MSPLDAFSEPVWQRLTWTLLHFLWQGVAVAGVLAAVLRLFRVRQARARYALCLSAMVVMAACPVVTFAVLEVAQGGRPAEQSPIAAPRAVRLHPGPPPIPGPPDEPDVSPRGDVSPQYQDPLLPATNEVAGDGPLPSQGTTPWRLRFSAYAIAVQPYLLLSWIAGVFLLSGRLLLAQASVQWLRLSRWPIPGELASRAAWLAERLGLRSVPRVFSSQRIRESLVIGLFRPIVLLPAAWLLEMTPEVLEAVIAHELAHIRRWDLWVNLFQRLVETLLFYHPVVWWLSRRVRLEREMCCDESAVAATGERVAYVAVLELVGRKRLTLTRPELGAPMGGTKMTLVSRVRNVLGLWPGHERSRWWPVGLLALSVPLAVWFASTTVIQPGGRQARAEGTEQPNPKAASGIARWIEKLQDKDVEVRRTAAKALQEMGPGAKEAVPALVKALQDQDELVRANAARALGSIGPEAEQAIPNLIEALQDDVMIVRMGAAAGLGRIGPTAKKAIPALAKALQNPVEDHNVLREAAEALGRMGPDAIPALARALQSENYFARRFSAGALGGTGAGAVPALIKALEDEDWSVRVIAVQALGGIGPEAKQSIPALTRALQDKRYNVRASATRALWLIRGETRETQKTGGFPHGKVQDGLAAFLLCHKNRFEVGEPVPLTYGIILVGPGLEARGEEAYKLEAKVWRPWPAVDPDNGSWFEVTGPDGASVPYMGLCVTHPVRSPSPSNTATLRYREFLGRTHSDLCAQGAFDLSKPGTYKVRWGYEPWGKEGPWVGKLISNDVQFEIVAD